MPRRREPKEGSSRAVDSLVVIGASAGGIEALSAVVSGLLPTFPAPIVVAQHLHPDHPSSLVEIIARRTELKVLAVQDRMPLERGTVYIAPPNHHVSISDHEIRLETQDGTRPKPSIDRLLETASEVFGERLVAVILSGTGSDGAAGARYVAEAGGSVIAQDPETAAFPAMPRSLSPSTVDAVTRLDAIGPLLEDLVGGTTTIKDGEDNLDRFLGHLRDRSGIDFAAYKRPTVVRRIERRMATTRSSGLAEYRRYILLHPEEVHRLTSSLLIKVTDFFRDPDLFDELRRTVLPRLIKEAAGGPRELRLWSAGCATGEEAYSLAIILAELIGDDLPSWTIRIFATDADPQAIAFARRGIYPSSAVASIPADLLELHFRHVDGHYEVAPHIRALTVFGQHDLGQRAPFPRIDLILCRNVLIYFTPELQRRALQLFAFSLRDGCCLVLGKAETTKPLPSSFVVEDSALRIFRRVGERILVPSGSLGELPPVEAPPPSIGRRSVTPVSPARLRDRASPTTTATGRAEAILMRLPLGVCVVDSSYDLQFLNTAARSLLGIHGSAIGQDFVHLARSLDSDHLRQALDRALAGDAAQETFDVASETPVGASRILEVTAAPLSFDAGGSLDRTVIVTVLDVSRERSASAASDAGRIRAEAELARLLAQVERLAEANRELLRGNDELANANAELRSTNEELVVYSEELQAASEEVETLNEELQATNEELETLNEELQATVEELNTANDDLAARSIEADEDLRTFPRPAALSVVGDRTDEDGTPSDR